MTIGYLKVELTPWHFMEGQSILRIQVKVNAREYSQEVPLRQNDIVPLIDTMFDRALHLFKAEILKEEPDDQD